MTCDEVEEYNRKLHPPTPETPVPHVFDFAWVSGRPGRQLAHLTHDGNHEVMYYNYGIDDPEVRLRDKDGPF